MSLRIEAEHAIISESENGEVFIEYTDPVYDTGFVFMYYDVDDLRKDVNLFQQFLIKRGRT